MQTYLKPFVSTWHGSDSDWYRVILNDFKCKYVLKEIFQKYLLVFPAFGKEVLLAADDKSHTVMVDDSDDAIFMVLMVRDIGGW